MSQLSNWLLMVYARKYATSLRSKKEQGEYLADSWTKGRAKAGTRIGVHASIELFERMGALYLIYYALLLPSNLLTSDRL